MQTQRWSEADGDVTRFLATRYEDDIARLAQTDDVFLRVSWQEVATFDQALADDVLTDPWGARPEFEAALSEVDLPVDADLSDVQIQFVDLPGDRRYAPDEFTWKDSGYVAVEGDLKQATTKDEIPTRTIFVCQRCDTSTEVVQQPGEYSEPHECPGCERQGPFEVDAARSEWADFARIRIETPPEDAGTPNAEHIDGYCVGPVIHEGGEHGLLGRVGDRVRVYGELERREKSDTDMDGLFERVLRVRGVDFTDDDDPVDIPAHREAFETWAARDDAVDRLAESIAPALYQTDAWETAMEWAVAYLFGAPRIRLPDGTVYRGDIHGAIISDYGMGKSMFSHGIEKLSPEVIRKSATSLSSDVGLTAAAVQDDFGGGQWTLKPGILVRGDGGHVVLDEIDKGPDDLHKINDAIEGQQRIDVEKAGLSATYSSKAGVLVLGNPEEGRFDPHAPVAQQIGVDPSLLSRFDGIITMRDVADETIDAHIAEQVVEGYAEGSEYRYGDLDREDFEALDRPVDAEVARAWIAHARQSVDPVFDKALVDDIRDWYAEEVRQLNEEFAGEGEGGEMPVPVTARVVMWVIRFSTAFARCHLRERVTESDVDRATALAKRLVAQNWDGEQFVPDAAKEQTQNDRITRILDAIEETARTPSEIAEEVGLPEEMVETQLSQLSSDGRVITPETGVYRSV